MTRERLTNYVSEWRIMAGSGLSPPPTASPTANHPRPALPASYTSRQPHRKHGFRLIGPRIDPAAMRLGNFPRDEQA